jgi:hypothetical protein
VLLVGTSNVKEHAASIFRVEMSRLRMRSGYMEDVYSDPREEAADRFQLGQ